MKPTSDPPRLVDGDAAGFPESLRVMVESARDELPTDAQVGSLAKRLGPLLGPPTGGDGGGDPSGGGGPSGGLAPAGGSSIAPAASGAGLAVWKVGGAVAIVASVAGLAILSGPTKPSNEPSIEPAPIAVASSPSVSSPVVSASPTAPPATAPTEPTSIPDLPASGSAFPLNAAPADAGETDLELLQAAQAALASSPLRALSLTREHATRFPNSAMSQEREMIAINALLAAGRDDEARDRARLFIVRHPSSAHRQRLEAMLSSEK